MPEGDDIAGHAQALRPWLVDREILGVESRWPRVVQGLSGTTVREIRTHGKHLLIGFSDHTTLRIHLKMTGTWHRYDPGERWQKSRGDLAFSLTTPEDVVVCFKAPDVERIDDRALSTHPVLTALGPDLIPEIVDYDEVIARLRASKVDNNADLLLTQAVAAGLGNVYKSELLFLFELSPFGNPADVSDETWRAVYARGSELLQKNIGRRRNTTGMQRPSHFVYNRTRRPCLRCRAPIQYCRFGRHNRHTYWCPGCQE